MNKWIFHGKEKKAIWNDMGARMQNFGCLGALALELHIPRFGIQLCHVLLTM